LVRGGNKTFSWLFDTGAAVTCMNKVSFDLALGHSKPKQISKSQSCVAASGDKMSSYGVFEVDLFIKGKQFTHPVNVIQELNENIIGIDFIHAHKLTYDVISRRVKFAGAGTNSIVALKNTVLPAMTSTVVKAKFKGTIDEKATYIANICAPRTPMISGMPSSIVNVDENNICNIVVENCAPYDVTLERDDVLGVIETEEDELVPLTDDFIASVCQDIHNRFPKVKRKILSREEIRQRCHLQVLEEFQERYLDILCKHQDTLSIDKYDLGLAKDFKHKIHLKNQDPVYRKQFKIPEAHHQFIEQTLDELLKFGVIKRSNSLYNSPIFCVPKKKQGQGLQIVQDFRELNQNSHIDKYSMKEITECIGDIGRADSTIFTMLNLTSGFWQMQLDEDSQKLTAFTIPGKGQFHWITSPMGLLGCPASFQ
jgi:hypothetical protein